MSPNANFQNEARRDMTASSVADVDDEKDNVGFFDGYANLLVDFAFEDVFGVDHPTAGVDNREFLTAPIHFAVLTVASCA